MRRLILSILVLSISVIAHAVDVEQLWSSANSSYSEGKYKEALESYTKIELGAGVSASLYYNIGNCYFKGGDLGKALLYYYRAERLEPNNRDIKHNIETANTLTLNKIPTVEQFFVVRWLKSIANIATSNGWATLSIVLFLLTMSMVVIFTISVKSGARKFSFGVGAFALVLMVVSIAASTYKKGLLTSTNEAVIMDKAVPVKSSPDDSGKDLFVLSEGIKVSIDERVGKWSEITISSGESGWVESSNLEII